MRPHLIVEASGALFAIDQASVREIVPARHLSRLPGAPSAVRGVLNVRGTLVTVLDLARHFTTGRVAAPEPSVVIGVTEGRTLGLLVDDVADVQPLAMDTLVAPDDAQRAAGVLGMGHFGERIVLAVDLQVLVRQTLA